MSYKYLVYMCKYNTYLHPYIYEVYLKEADVQYGPVIDNITRRLVSSRFNRDI